MAKELRAEFRLNGTELAAELRLIEVLHKAGVNFKLKRCKLIVKGSENVAKAIDVAAWWRHVSVIAPAKLHGDIGLTILDVYIDTLATDIPSEVRKVNGYNDGLSVYLSFFLNEEGKLTVRHSNEAPDKRKVGYLTLIELIKAYNKQYYRNGKEVK